MSSEQQRQYLKHMGIPVWVRRNPTPVDDSPQPEQPTVRIGEQANVDATAVQRDLASMDWSALQAAVNNCDDCSLHQHRQHPVFGVGDKQARWLVVGEGPSAEEEQLGEPFVGKPGQLLNAMIHACGADRSQVYMSNIVKCHSPEKNNPSTEEAACCSAYLQRQIELIEPQLILAVGKVAAQYLLNSELPIGKMRGQTYQYGDSTIPVVVTYHPAYLLRKPSDKAKAWEDLCGAMRLVKAR